MEAAIILISGMLAFPSPWRLKLIGIGIGIGIENSGRRTGFDPDTPWQLRVFPSRGPRPGGPPDDSPARERWVPSPHESQPRRGDRRGADLVSPFQGLRISLSNYRGLTPTATAVPPLARLKTGYQHKLNGIPSERAACGTSCWF